MSEVWPYCRAGHAVRVPKLQIPGHIILPAVSSRSSAAGIIPVAGGTYSAVLAVILTFASASMIP